MKETDRHVEEVLEFIWSEREAGRDSVATLLKVDEVAESGADESTLKEMESAGLLSLSGDSVKLTAKGEELSKNAIRRHRLAERLLTSVLEIDPDLAEKTACDFEHSLSPLVTDSICTLLAHPPTCPHGHKIPKGDCCRATSRTIEPLVKSLKELEVGESGRIIFVLSKSHARLDRLGTMGIVPGSVIRLHQKSPAFVIEIGETTLALDPDIVGEIFVKKAN
jgi:DtxR family Mn-dependent transcriptional regulator